MPTVKVDNLGQIGLVADKEAVTLPPNAWSELQNIRCEDRSIKPFEGSVSIGTPSVDPETIIQVKSASADYVVYAGGTAIYSFIGGASTDISGKTYNSAGWWDSCTLGGVAILNNGTENPQYWGGAGTAVDLPYDSTDTDNICTWDDVGMTARVIRPFRYHLFAFNIDDCAGRNNRKVWWSHPAEPGTVPITWNPTKAEYDAGFMELSDTTGRIIDALAMRDTLQIYKEDAVYSATYTGRQDNQIFNFRLVTDSKGIFARNCVCDIGGRHFFIADGDFYLYDGTNFRSIADERVKRHFFENVEPQANIKKLTHVLYYQRTGEVWVCYPEVGESRCTKALIWDSNSDTWSVRQIQGANCGIFAKVDVVDPTATTWGELAGTTWGDHSGTTWGDWRATNANTAVDESFLLASDTDIYRMDSGDNTEDGVTMTCYARRTHMDLGDKQDWHMVSQVRPYADGAAFRVRVGYHNIIDSSVTWSDYQTFTPGTDYKIDFRVTGRMHAIEFSSAADVAWRVNGYEVDYVEVGRR